MGKMKTIKANISTAKKRLDQTASDLKNLPRDKLLDHFRNEMKKRQIAWTAKGNPITEAELESGLREEWNKGNKIVYLEAGINFTELLAVGIEAINDTSGVYDPPIPKTFKRLVEKIGRNQQCPCGSGKKYKKCCGKDE